MRGRSSVWLEHSTVTREVAGSSPVGPVLVPFAFPVSCWRFPVFGCSVIGSSNEEPNNRLTGNDEQETGKFAVRSRFALVVKLVDTPS